MKAVRLLAAMLCLAAGPASADEGMWPFDNIPLRAVEASTGVAVSGDFLDHLQATGVRLATVGCSASVVSPDGLVMTNDHCVLDCTHALSDAGHDYLRDGFFTDDRRQERQCPGLEAHILVAITDVTAKVNAAAARAGADYVKARDAALARAEKDACRMPGSGRCQAVSLYRGGQFKVYRYKRYGDVRLVFAPEFQAFYFGGDPANFGFPRYAWDVAFLRLYENGRPAHTPEHLAWSTAAPAEHEPVFIVGNPGGTERLLTASQLATLRDLVLPLDQKQREALRDRLKAYSALGDANRKSAADALFTVENVHDVYAGRQLALADPALFRAKAVEEANLKARAGEDPWAEMAHIQTIYVRRYPRWRQLEAEAGRGSKLFGYARTLVRVATERSKPDAQRDPEFAESRLTATERRVLTPDPVDPGLEAVYLEHWLASTRDLLGADDPAVRRMLGGDAPEAVARRLVQTRLADPAYRKRLWDGGLSAMLASDDPLIRFVLATDPDARAEREAWRTEVSGPTEIVADKIARARFSVFGDSVYPDATFSPRFSYGRVEGWTWQGSTVAPFTAFGGMFATATGQEPYVLPPSFVAAKDRVNPQTVLDFTTTNDVVGGSSGSPVVNARGELVGLIFDGNLHSLGGDYGYDPALNRALAVSTAAITEGLQAIYARTALVRELTGR
ncbi:MAG: S46 family peptidase [Parcubacteria group bacterium]